MAAASPDALPAPVAPPLAPAAAAAEVVVTGTHLRGVTDQASPVITVSRQDIDRRGYGTVAEALQALPQNFGGSANPQSLYTHQDASNSNTLAATGVNLRGLGADATLVLVNGRRMAGTGAFGDFADISTLPTAAVDRIEVLTDGASAIYGADAVGGVVNIIMRRDFDGAETRLRYGGTTSGPDNQIQFAQTFGKTWSGGNALISYEYDLQTALPSDARAYAANADLRPLGGSDDRTMYSHPGNLLAYNAALGAYVPTYAIPTGQSGVGLTSAALIAGGENLNNTRADTDLTPRQERHSVYASVSQDVGARFTLSGDARYGWRRYDVSDGDSQTILQVTPANPYFVAPPGGGTSDLIGYNLGGDIGPGHTRGVVQSIGATGGADMKLVGDWRLSSYVAYAAELGSVRNSNEVNATYLNEALGVTPNNPATPFTPAVSGYFNPFGAGHDNPAAVTSFISSGYDTSTQNSQVETAEAQIDGSLFALPGGPLKLALGGQFRHESFSTGGVSFLSGLAPTAKSHIDVGREVGAGFVELDAPLVSAQNARLGLQRLELSLAGRVEDYSDVGVTANPKIGLIWAPLRDLAVHASYGTSFRAPALAEVDAPSSYNPSLLPKGAAQILSLVLDGGNTGLKPETADSWTVGGAYTPHLIPNLRPEPHLVSHPLRRPDRPAGAAESAHRAHRPDAGQLRGRDPPQHQRRRSGADQRPARLARLARQRPVPAPILRDHRRRPLCQRREPAGQRARLRPELQPQLARQPLRPDRRRLLPPAVRPPGHAHRPYRGARRRRRLSGGFPQPGGRHLEPGAVQRHAGRQLSGR